MNRWCLRCFVKVSGDEAFHISGGREFQRAWAATLKALSPNVLSLVWRGERGGADRCQRIIVSGRAGEGRLGTEGQGGICM